MPRKRTTLTASVIHLHATIEATGDGNSLVSGDYHRSAMP